MQDKRKRYVIVGAGPVGTALAERLVSAGHEVLAVSRSGTGPEIAGLTRIAADASDPDRLSELCEGASALFNCANPSDYTVWAQVWPPLAESLLTAAERSGATLVVAGTLYPYGPVAGPMTESQPDLATDTKGKIRAAMWAEAKRRHDAGRLHAVEVRGSDYLGAGVGANGHIPRHLPAARRGKTAWVMGSPDLPHTWTDVYDMARTLEAVAERPDTWGQVWHAPSHPPRTQREALAEVLAAEGRPPVPVRGMPPRLLAVASIFMPLVRELNAMAYMFQRPYVMDSSHTQQTLGLKPSPWADICRRTAGTEQAED